MDTQSHGPSPEAARQEYEHLRATIVGAIKTRKLRPLPKWHFMLRAAMIGTGVTLVALALVFVASLIVFLTHANGTWFAPSFGLSGFRTLVFSLPWLLIVLALVFVALLEALVKRYEFAYRQPLLYTAVGIVLVAAAGGYAVSSTPLHRDIFVAARRPGGVPIGGQVYRGYGMRSPVNVTPGVVLDLNDDGFLMRDRLDETLTVLVTPQTRFPFGTSISAADVVVVFGERKGDSITAEGVRRIDDDTFEHGEARPSGRVRIWIRNDGSERPPRDFYRESTPAPAPDPSGLPETLVE